MNNYATTILPSYNLENELILKDLLTNCSDSSATGDPAVYGVFDSSRNPKYVVLL